MNTTTILKNSINSAFSLFLRQIFVQITNFATTIFLARELTVSEYGTLGILVFLLSLINVFSGTALATNLVRQLKEPTDYEYRAVQTFYQLFTVCIAVLMLMFSGSFAQLYRLPETGSLLMYSAAVCIVIAPISVISQIRLERKLDFHKIAIVEVAQIIIYSLALIVTAFTKVGLAGFAVALLLRMAVGVVFFQISEFWLRPYLFNWGLARLHFKYGLFLQAGHFISIIKESITPVFVGLYLGTAQVGYINWAATVATYPVLALMIFQRLYIPIFSRLQHEKHTLKRFFEHVIMITNTIVAPLSVIILVFITPITKYVFGLQWSEALPVFYFLWCANLFVATTTPALGLLTALGGANIVFFYTVVWAVLTWLFGLPLIASLGFIGYGVANLLVLFSNFFFLNTLKKFIDIRILYFTYKPWLCALLIGLVFTYTLSLMNSILDITLYCLLFIFIYVLLIKIFLNKEISAFLRLLRAKS